MNGGLSQYARVLADVERRAPARDGIADLRSAILAATQARQMFRVICHPNARRVSESRFGELEAAYLETANEVRDALGALGLVPSEINSLGEIL